VIENGAFVWLVKREYHPCDEQCRFIHTCPTYDQLKRGTRIATYVHVNIADTPTRVRIEVPRWFLEDEEETIELEVPLPHPGMAVGHRFTTEALEFVIRKLLDPRIPIEQIADWVGKNRKTIDRIKDEFIPMPPWPITLCINPAMKSLRIDEIYIPKRGKNRKPYTLLFNATHNSFIGLIPGKSKEASLCHR